MINRRLTRVVLNSVEKTDLLFNPNGTGITQSFLTSDALYIGYHSKFASRYLVMGTPVNTVASVMSVKYWDGAAFSDVDDLQDQTSVGGKTLAQSGFISWVNKSDWALSTLSGVDTDIELYWIKITFSVSTTASIVVKAIINLFADDQLLQAYYPEFISNTSYLPSGRTHYLEQHLAAKDLVVLRMKQRRLIDEEGQIIDASSVAIAAVHACAWLILNPISTNEVNRHLAESAKAEFENEIQMLQLDVDKNKDGVISASERAYLSSPKIVRR